MRKLVGVDATMSVCGARGIVEQADHSRVLGRERELAEIDRFVAAAPSGPRALVLEGSAGIGKTTLWEAGIGTADAAGIRVLDSRAAESEATLSYSGLGDLFDPVFDEAGTGLPEPQRRALDAALLRADDAVPVPDRRAISLGALGVVRTLAARSPLLIALDDVQWLDTSTANVVAFVLRRLAEEPVRIIASQRHGAGTPSGRLELAEAIGRDRVDRVTVGPLDEEATGRMLRARLGADLSRPVILRIHSVSQGNPLFALEIARAIAGLDTPQLSGEQFPVPEDLRRLLAARVGVLPAAARQTLLTVACLTHPTVDIVLAVASRPDEARQGLSAAEAAGVIDRTGERVRFSHRCSDRPCMRRRPLVICGRSISGSPSASPTLRNVLGTWRSRRSVPMQRSPPNSTKRRGTLARVARRMQPQSSRSSHCSERPMRTPSGCASEGSKPPGITSTPATLPRRSSCSGSPGRTRRPVPPTRRSSTARPR